MTRPPAEARLNSNYIAKRFIKTVPKYICQKTSSLVERTNKVKGNIASLFKIEIGYIYVLVQYMRANVTNVLNCRDAQSVKE